MWIRRLKLVVERTTSIVQIALKIKKIERLLINMFTGYELPVKALESFEDGREAFTVQSSESGINDTRCRMRNT